MTTPEREVLTWELFGTASRELAALVHASGFEPDVVLGIARGGLVPAGAIAYALDCKNLFALNVEFYTGVGTTRDAPVILPPFLNAADLDGKSVLVVDDVADSGRTLELVVEFCRGHGDDVRTAVLYDKPASVVTPTYTWRSTERWINFPWSEPPLVDRTGVLDV